MKSGAAGWGYRQSGYRQLNNQATSASRWSHRVKRLPSVSGRRLSIDAGGYAPRPGQRLVTF